MIFKVFYQENKEEVPIRENTKVLYVEGESLEDVRKKLADRNYNIEYIQEIKGKFLEYEKESKSFELENV
ncbi:DNA-directed RNA polymerase subunit epsilon [Fictibacillus sp. Mic-4]|uniref:DNA-dependent RNA polymerase subunit epsilon n=1 Tax=Fictibacillus TaxID=1329200 RepID=UPI000422DA45|nr:DNA-directed RNA polymerase subunit epsilon [Fictibacillus gelatini]